MTTPFESETSATEVYAGRRARVLERLGEDAVLVLTAAAEQETALRYRPDPELYYLSGFAEPEAALVLAPGAAAPFTLFVRPRDPERELWTGRRAGVEGAREHYGADQAHPIAELEQHLPDLLQGRAAIHARLGADPRLDRLLRQELERARAARQRTGRGAHTLVDPGVLLDGMRVLKDSHELALLRRAADISVQGFRDCMPAVRDGAGEWEVQALLEYGFRRLGADGPSFASIVGAGNNATVLHYMANEHRMHAGELLLIDAGAAWHQYAGDITRTVPVSGRFSAAQRALYEVVLAAHDAALAAVRPGAPVDGVHQAALRALVEGLVQQGLLAGEPAELCRQEEAYKPFYPHRTSHWLGLDVHDAGDYTRNGAPRPLEPGMVLTIEPGLYLSAAREGLPADLAGTGIRLEDDVLVTGVGAEVLTAALPLRPDDVEQMLSR